MCFCLVFLFKKGRCCFKNTEGQCQQKFEKSEAHIFSTISLNFAIQE